MKPLRTVAILFVAAAISAANAAPTYSVVAALRISDFRTAALAVNELGQIAGFRAYTGTTTVGKKTVKYEGRNAFVTDADGANPLDVLPITGTGIVTSGRCKGLVFSNSLTAVNASGVAVGGSTVSVGSGTTLTYVQHAIVYKDGTLTDIGTLGDLTSASVAAGINASGLIVGTSITSNRATHAFSFDGTATLDLGTLGGKYSSAAAVNDAGTIVGGSTVAKGAIHPFRYASGTMTDLGLPDGFSNGTASAISSTGTIVGYGYSGQTIAAFSYTGGVYTKLASLYTAGRKNIGTAMQPTGVNADGTIVGNTMNASGRPRAFIVQAGTAYDLNASLPTAYATWSIVSASAITNSGYVSAIGLDSTGKQYALLLKLGA